MQVFSYIAVPREHADAKMRAIQLLDQLQVDGMNYALRVCDCDYGKRAIKYALDNREKITP